MSDVTPTAMSFKIPFPFLQIDQTDFGLDIEYLLKGMENPLVMAYLSYQVDIAVQFGADKGRAEKQMMDALEFEIRLANVKMKFCLL